jgi:hypothetical protein
MALRKFAPLAFGVVALGILPVLAADTDHTYTLLTVSKEHAIFADENARTAPGGYVKLTLLTVPGLGTAAYQLSTVEISCGASMLIDVSATPYKADGTAMPPTVPDPTPKAIVAGTVGEAIQKYTCEGADPYPRSKRLTGIPDAISKARDLIAETVKKGGA